jgi:hypothetical protein
VGAGRHERAADRLNWRNCYRERNPRQHHRSWRNVDWRSRINTWDAGNTREGVKGGLVGRPEQNGSLFHPTALLMPWR